MGKKINYKKQREEVIEVALEAVQELKKILSQNIDLDELDAEKAKAAASAKKLAMDDAFSMLDRIQLEQESLNADSKEITDKQKKIAESSKGFAETMGR